MEVTHHVPVNKTSRKKKRGGDVVGMGGVGSGQGKAGLEHNVRHA